MAVLSSLSMRAAVRVVMIFGVLALWVLTGPVAAMMGPCSTMGGNCEGPCGNALPVPFVPVGGPSPVLVFSLPDHAGPGLLSGIPRVLDRPPRTSSLSA